MTHIAVLGAGVIGVTTAWYLRKAGYDVTVIERESAAGMQTSFASGGQISVSHAIPWSNPKAPIQVLRGLFSEDAPLAYRLRADKTQFKWVVQFLQECRATSYDANLVQLVRLGLYSRSALQQLRRNTDIEYEQQTRGIMHFYTSQAEYDAAIAPTERMQELGCERHFIDIDTAASLEPALYPIAHKLKGATYTSRDESGNTYLFTQRLAALCAEAGVRFMYNTTVLALNADAHSSHPHVHSITIRPAGENAQTFSADSHVLALGSYSVLLVKPLDIHLPIFPAKGYSATYRVNPRAPHLAPFISLVDDEHKLVISRLGDKLRVAGTAEFTGYNLALNSIRCEAITQRVRYLFPKGIVANYVKYWAGLQPMTPSNVPLIGRAHSGQVRHGSHNPEATFDNLWLNTGHGALGWTHACGSAQAISLLMQGEIPKVNFDFVGINNN